MVAVAVIGSAIVGAGASAYSSNKASKSASKAQKSANKNASTQISYEKERLASEEARYEKDSAKEQKRYEANVGRYEDSLARHQASIDDWENTFGSIQDNLSDYFQNLSPDMRAAKGIQDFEGQRATAMKQVQEQFAQRGISGGGAEASAMLQDAVSSSEARAGIRNQAEQSVVEDKQQFLSMGLGTKPAANMGGAGPTGPRLLNAPTGQGVSNAMANQTNSMQDQANWMQQNASQQAQQTGQAVAGVATAGIDYLVQKFDTPAGEV